MTPVELYGANRDGEPTSWTVADGTQISKGISLQLSDPFTAAAAAGVSAQKALPAAGIASMEKEASDGSTRISAWTQGKFDAVASSAITAGDYVVFVADGYIAQLHANTILASGAIAAGKALETAADAEKINFKLNI